VNANSDIAAAANLNGDEAIGSLTGNNTSLTASNFSAIAISKTFTNQAEVLATHTGGAVTVANAATYSFDLTINGSTNTVTYTSDGSATIAEISAGLEASAQGFGGKFANIDITDDGTNLTIATTDADSDLTIANRTANTGITNGTYNSTSLLDRVTAGGGVAGTSSISVTVNGGTAQDITFGTGVGEVSTVADLNTELQALTGGVSASIAGTTLSFSLAAGATNTLGLSVSDTGVRTALGLGTARTAGQGGGLGTTVTDLSRTYNSAATLADADPTNLLNGGNLTITVNGSAQTVGLSGSDRLTDIISKLQGNATLNNNLTFEDDANGDLKITAKTADVDFVVTHNNTAAAIGLTSGSNVTTNSTSLFDRLSAGGVLGSAAQGSTLTIAANGGATQTITFGTGTGEISTKAELSTALSNLSGVTGSLTGTSLNLQVASSSSQTSLTIGGTAAAKFGLTVGTSQGTQTSTTNNSTRAALQNDYNDVLTQIDTLAKDSSYNGVNLLNGDNLKVVFNEKGTSTLNISGVTFSSTGLGLSSVSGTAFQVDSQIDTTINSLDTALSSLRTQASKFGSSLTTVQTRQDFTKQMINTLQTGADALVLADTNEEGANLLALQTRQQLSSTALSLSAQADQAVLRLF
jgi:hypothetical protein